MSHYLTEQIRVRPNIRVQPFSQVQAAEGDTRLERLVIANKQAGAIETVPADALFIFIGTAPRTDWVASLVARDEQGFILSGGDLLRNASVNMSSWTLSRDPLWLETSVPGIFVAGDVRHRSIKRVASAVGEGSMAVMFVHQHLASL
jgi:thioredoxin reductase (NADPH)